MKTCLLKLCVFELESARWCSASSLYIRLPFLPKIVRHILTLKLVLPQEVIITVLGVGIVAFILALYPGSCSFYLCKAGFYFNIFESTKLSLILVAGISTFTRHMSGKVAHELHWLNWWLIKWRISTIAHYLLFIFELSKDNLELFISGLKNLTLKNKEFLWNHRLKLLCQFYLNVGNNLKSKAF